MVRQSEPGRVRTLLMEHRQPVFLLGAGASIRSGVPDACETVNRAAKWAWCKDHARSTEDPSVVSSDWRPWLESLPWFKQGVSLADQYPVAIDNLLGIGNDKREFFEQLISRKVDPSPGYKALARILDNGWIATVLTTNFDQCLYRAVIIEATPPHLVEIKTSSDWVRYNASPPNPQVIHIHGSVEHYSDKNLEKEVTTLDTSIVDRLKPLFRDHPLVVIGYRGTEASVMTDLLHDQADFTNGFNHGVFWCELKRKGDSPLAPLVQKFAARIGSNFNRVPIEGFDHFIEVDLYNQLVAQKAQRKQLGPMLPDIKLPLDMRDFKRGNYVDLDEQLLFQRLCQYAKKHSEPLPDSFDDNWVRDFAVAKKLIQKLEKSNGHVPTFAGWIMFSKNPTPALQNAVVDFTVSGPEAWLRKAFGDDAELQRDSQQNEYFVSRRIGGTIWNQLNILIETIALLNEPFLLKEAKSRSVTAYEPNAVKEMIVNALVHRDYSVEVPIKIAMTPKKIETVSPGGLIDEVAAKTGGKEIEVLIRGGSRGDLKGYRNPVISSLFYGSGEMERRGSGLSDMFQRTIDNNGEVKFHTTKENSEFRVVIYSRPEAVDEVTRTAVADQSKTVRFTANLVEFVSLPEQIWHVGTSAKSALGLAKSAEGLPVPPGCVQNERFFSFYNLKGFTSNLVTPFDESDVEALTIPELFKQGSGLNILRQLLYEAISEHFRAIGLIVDKERRRAHFPSCQESSRKITYRGRVKRATRTIVKARTKRDSNQIIYYEHKSFTYSIAPFGVKWGMFINPGYVFTRDGRNRFLGRERTSVLSTKRAARDFNMTVMHDVMFWMACFSEEADGVFALRTENRNKFTKYAPVILLNSAFPRIAFNSNAFSGDRSIGDEIERTLIEVDQELEELAVKEENEDEGYLGNLGRSKINDTEGQS